MDAWSCTGRICSSMTVPDHQLQVCNYGSFHSCSWCQKIRRSSVSHQKTAELVPSPESCFLAIHGFTWLGFPSFIIPIRLLNSALKSWEPSLNWTEFRPYIAPRYAHQAQENSWRANSYVRLLVTYQVALVPLAIGCQARPYAVTLQPYARGKYSVEYSSHVTPKINLPKDRISNQQSVTILYTSSTYMNRSSHGLAHEKGFDFSTHKIEYILQVTTTNPPLIMKGENTIWMNGFCKVTTQHYTREPVSQTSPPVTTPWEGSAWTEKLWNPSTNSRCKRLPEVPFPDHAFGESPKVHKVRDCTSSYTQLQGFR